MDDPLALLRRAVETDAQADDPLANLRQEATRPPDWSSDPKAQQAEQWAMQKHSDAPVTVMGVPGWKLNLGKEVGSETLGGVGISVKDVLRKAIPFTELQGRVDAEKYGKAKQAYEKGEATDEQYGQIAEFELDQKREGARSQRSKIAAAGLGVPKIVGEFAAAGPVIRGVAGALGGGAAATAAGTVAATPLMPEFFLEESQQRANKNGGDWFDPENVAAPLAKAAVQNVILGQIGKTANSQAVANTASTGLGRFAAKSAVAGAAMPIESAAAEALTSRVQDALDGAGFDKYLDPKEERYRTFRDMREGKWGDVGTKLATDSLLGAGFAAFHGRQADVPGKLQAAAESLKEAGVPEPQIPVVIQEAVGKPDTATGQVKEFVDALAEAGKGAKEGAKNTHLAPEKPPEPTNPIESLSKEELADLAKAVGWKPAKLKEHANEPWVAALIDAVRGKAQPEPPKSPVEPRSPEPGPEAVRPEIAPPEPAQRAQADSIAPVQDRRQNVAERKRVADMTPEERANELLRSPLVDLPNRRAFDEAGPAKAVAMSDADGLKAFNDKFGYEAGNSLLRAKAKALKDAGLDAYHEKGDEFLARGEDVADLQAKLEKAREILRSHTIEVDLADGTTKKFRGADFSFGVANELSAAEKGLKAHKAEREARGERARGELRGIVEVGPEVGQGSPGRPPEEGQVARDLFKQPIPKRFGARKKEQITLDDLHRERDRSAEPPPEMGKVEDLLPGEFGVEKPQLPQNEGVGKPLAKSAKERFEAGEPVAFDEVAQEKGLTKFEAHVVRERTAGRSFEEIAQDPESRKPNGKAFTRQRIEQVERNANKKLGLGESVRKAVHDREQVERGRILAEQGGRVGGKELRADPEEVKAVGKRKLTAEEQRNAAIEQIGTDLIEGKINGQEAERRFADLAARRNPGQPQGRGRPEGVPSQPGKLPAQDLTAPKPPPGPRKGLGRRVQNDNLKQNREPRSLVAQLRKGGGVSKESAKSIGLDVDSMASMRPSPFEDARGNPSKRHIEDVIPELVRSGDLTESPKEHLHDQLVRKLQRNDPSAEGVESANWEKAHLEFLKKQEAEFEASQRHAITSFLADEGLPSAPINEPGMLGGAMPVRGAESFTLNLGQQRTAKEFALAKERVTEERAERGEQAVLKEAARSNPKGWEEAIATLKRDTRAGEEVVKRIEDGGAFDPDRDIPLLLLRRVALSNLHEAAQREFNRMAGEAMADKSKAPLVEQARRKVEDALAERNRLDLATNKAGAQIGRALQFFKQLAKEDYSLAGMIRGAEVAKRAPLTDAERQKIEAMQKRIEELEAELEKVKEGGKGKEGDKADVQVKINRTKKEFEEQLTLFKDLHLTALQKVQRRAMDVLSASRSLITAFDLSVVARQGAFAIGHPVKASRNLKSSLGFLANRHSYDKAMLLIGERPNAERYKDAGLEFTDADAPIAKQDEAFMGRLLGKDPTAEDWKVWYKAPLNVVRAGVSASARQFNGYLNLARADLYDMMSASMTRSGIPTEIEAKALANAINVGSGRAKVPGGMKGAFAGLAQVFFSPRYVLSRFQILAGQPLWGGTWRTRKVIAQEMGRTLIGLGAFYGLARVLFGDEAEISTDPRSSDFGKVKIGDLRVDPLAGLSQASVFLSRLTSGETKDSSGKTTDLRPRVFGLRKPAAKGQSDAMDVTGRFLRSKLAPIPGVAADVLTGKDFKGDRVTPKGEVAQLTVPLGLKDVYEALNTQGVPRGPAIGLLAILGMGTQVYDRRAK